jgi:hypothetical protein
MKMPDGILPIAAPIPGSRISGYRNSLPRLVRLFGLGEHGSRVAREVAARGLPNVEVITDVRPIGWDDIAKEHSGERINILVVVCGEGDEQLFSPVGGKPRILVTFVVLKDCAEVSDSKPAGLSQAGGQYDLFVTTSESDYVGELIDNLAS